MRTIKRYANRRLYDPESSKTITLDDVATLIKSKEEFQIIDNASNEDITNKILAQTFLKINLTGVDDTLNKYLLSTLIRESSENMQLFLQKMILSGIGLANQTKEYIEQMVHHINIDNQLESNLVTDLTKYISSQAEQLSDQVQNGIKNLGIAWPLVDPKQWEAKNIETTQLLEECQKQCETYEKEIESLKNTISQKEQEIYELKKMRHSSINPNHPSIET